MARFTFSRTSKALASLSEVGNESGRMADLPAGIECSVLQESQRGSLHSGMGRGASS